MSLGSGADASRRSRTHLLEETHELIEAIDVGDSDAIRDELGDLLLQVVFHAEIASDEGRWDVDDVARRLIEKLVHRHPHVFGEVEVSGAEEVLTNWEKLKAEEGTGPRPGVEEDDPGHAARPRQGGQSAAPSGRVGGRVGEP